MEQSRQGTVPASVCDVTHSGAGSLRASSFSLLTIIIIILLKIRGGFRHKSSMEENGGLAAGRRFGGDETEVDLGLSLGKNGRASRIGNCGALLAGDDFPSPALAPYGSPISSSSSSTASSSPTASTVARSLRPRGQMVGWPPVRAYRMNSVISQKNGAAESTHSKYDEFGRSEIADRAFNKNQNTRKRSFVKVNMDGVPIGRKVDLHSHNTYEELARALDEMFQQPNSEDEYLKCGKNSPLLDLSSGFVLTYEDQDGDWMLAGDVPWEMFLSTAQRLRIMRAADVTGLGLNGFTSIS